MRWAAIEPAEQRGHRRALVGEDPDIAPRAGQHERSGQGGDRARFVTGGRQRQRPQRADLDEAAGPVLGGRGRVQPAQQRKRPIGLPLGQQDARQHQVLTLAGVVRLVIRVQAAFLRPAGGLGQVALSQQQPRPLRRDRVEQPGRARRGLRGLADRLPGPGRVTAGLLDPRQRRQAGGQRREVGELAAQHNALAGMPERRVELVPLVGHLAQAHIRGACSRQRRPGGRSNGIQRLLAGPGRRV